MAIEELQPIPPGSFNQGQAHNDNIGKTNRNFAEIGETVAAGTTGVVKSVNSTTPTPDGNVVLPFPDGSKVEVFAVSGTWTKPAGAKSVYVICMSAGGGGVGYVNPNVQNVTGYGGGGGARVEHAFAAAGLPSSVPVTVGAGGTGGSHNSTSGAVVGTKGGASQFGTFLVASGGSVAVFNSGPGNGGGPWFVDEGANATSVGRIGTGGVGGTTTGEGRPWAAGGGGGASSGNGFAGGAGSTVQSTPNGVPLYNGADGTTLTSDALSITGVAGASRSGSGRCGDGGGGLAVIGTITGPNQITTGGAGGIPGGGGGASTQRRSASSGQATGTAFGGAGGRGEVIIITTF